MLVDSREWIRNFGVNPTLYFPKPQTLSLLKGGSWHGRAGATVGPAPPGRRVRDLAFLGFRVGGLGLRVWGLGLIRFGVKGVQRARA